MTTGTIIIIALATIAIIVTTAIIASRMARNKAMAQVSALSSEKELLLRQISEGKDEFATRLAESRHEASLQREEMKTDFQRQLDDKDKSYQKQLEEQTENYRHRLAEQSEQFKTQMELFRSQLRNDTQELLQKRQEELTKAGATSMDNIVKPLNERLQEMQQALDNTKKEGESNTTRIETSIQRMFEQTHVLGDKAEKLSEALRSKGKVQGDWGESILEEILEASGMQPGVHYETQKNYQDDEGNNQRPDVIIHCPDQRDVVVDSKVTLTDYYNYTMASTEEEMQAAARSNLQSVKKHVEELSRKHYASLSGNLQKMMLMFIPNEGSYLLALRQDSNLLNWAYEKNVIIVNQTSLMLTLHLIDALWKNVNQEKNAQKIFDLATLLYDRICDFTTEFSKIDRSLLSAHESYTNARNKLQENNGHNIIRSLEGLKDLGTKKSKKSLDDTVISQASLE